jgi:hypothetical protein
MKVTKNLIKRFKIPCFILDNSCKIFPVTQILMQCFESLTFLSFSHKYSNFNHSAYTQRTKSHYMRNESRTLCTLSTCNSLI